MIDVIIYADAAEMENGPTTSDIRKVLQDLGFNSIGLISMRNKDYVEDQYKEVVR